MKKMKLSLSMARKIQKLLKEGKVAGSDFPAEWGKELVEEGIISAVNRGTQRSYRLVDGQGLCTYLSQCYEIDDLEQWIAIKSGETEVRRADQVQMTGHSKVGNTRTFKGFLVRSIQPMIATLCGKPFPILPLKGASYFIESYESFRIPPEVVVVGMENGENFREVDAQRYLFEGVDVLFVSRYPQSGDLRNWLQQIPNRYLHFGDFDLAGISIYLTEFYAYLGNRAELFVPVDIEERLKHGNRSLYDQQCLRYAHMAVPDPRVLPLVELIHRYRCGYEQEGYIRLHAQPPVDHPTGKT